MKLCQTLGGLATIQRCRNLTLRCERVKAVLMRLLCRVRQTQLRSSATGRRWVLADDSCHPYVYTCKVWLIQRPHKGSAWIAGVGGYGYICQP
jgi:hypothetical protein